MKEEDLTQPKIRQDKELTNLLSPAALPTIDQSARTPDSKTIVGEIEMQKEQKIKKPSPPASGLSIAAAMWVWSLLAFYAPTYFGIVSGFGKTAFNVTGAVLLAISLCGALIELSKLWKNEALSYWGVSLVFIVPAILLQFVLWRQHLSHTLEVVVKIGVYCFLVLGIPFFLFGLPHLFVKIEKVPGALEENALEQPSNQKKKRGTAQTVVAMSIVVLNLVTAVIKLVEALVP